jgi:hypothetical protein
VRIRAIAGAVIGTFTSPWCWWQVPAHGVTAAGRGAGQDALAAEGASAPSFVTRQFSEVSAADWLRRPSVLTVRWGFLIPEWGSRQRPWPVR